MADVAEVAALPAVTRVPGSPAWLSGVANWRGRMLPVLDLRPLLATPTCRWPAAPGSSSWPVARSSSGSSPRPSPACTTATWTPGSRLRPRSAPDAGRLVLGQVADRHGPIAVLDVGAVLALRDRVDRRRHGG